MKQSRWIGKGGRGTRHGLCINVIFSHLDYGSIESGLYRNNKNIRPEHREPYPRVAKELEQPTLLEEEEGEDAPWKHHS